MAFELAEESVEDSKAGCRPARDLMSDPSRALFSEPAHMDLVVTEGKTPLLNLLTKTKETNCLC